MPVDAVAATTADAVLEHIRSGADLIVPLANGEPVTLLDAVERAADRLDRVRVHQMHALHDRPYLHGAFGDRLRHVSYFLSHVTRPVLPGRHDRPGTQPLQRDAGHPEGPHQGPTRPRRGLTSRPARLLQPRPQRRLRRLLHRAGPLLPRGQPADAAHLRAQPDPHQPGGRLDRGRLPARRGAASTGRTSSTAASPGSSPSGSRTRRRSRSASARSPTPSCRPSSTTATSASTPS